MTDSPPPLPEFSTPDPPAIDFASEDVLQRFLQIFLEHKGHTVYREVVCENGGRIDLLTSLYLIECKRYLNRNALHGAAGQLWVYRQHYPKLQPIIAGLTPKSNQEDAWAAAAKLKEAGIQIWFVDRMAEVVEFYAQMPPNWLTAAETGEDADADADGGDASTDPALSAGSVEDVSEAFAPLARFANLSGSSPSGASSSGSSSSDASSSDASSSGLAASPAAPLTQATPSVPEGRRRQRSVSAISLEAGCGALIGAGIVLAGFLMIARVFRGAPPTQLSATEQLHWADLHAAIPEWDVQTAKNVLIPLMKSGDPCVVSFSRSLNDSLDADGPEGFRQVNEIKRALNESESCQLSITPYEFAR